MNLENDKLKVFSIIFLSFVGFISIVIYPLSNVEKKLTKEDIRYLRDISLDLGDQVKVNSTNLAYSDQLAMIEIILRYFDLQTTNRKQQMIPIGSPREPRDWYANRVGVCHDLSRVVEKTFQYFGFEIRHLAIYSMKETGSALRSIVTRRNESHAVLQVHTQKGWLIVDPHDGSLLLDKRGDPIPAHELRLRIEQGDLLTPKHHPIFKHYYLVVYGLYSRHGGFFPPYNFLPDVNWADFIGSFCCEVSI